MAIMAKPANSGPMVIEPHTAPIERDSKTGRFLAGNSGNGGRRPGSRQKLASDFVSDLHAAWERHGVAALEATAQLEPAKFVQIVANVLPRDIQVDVDLRVERALDAVSAYRLLKNLPTNELKALRDAHTAD
jgi:hypothetical protein